MKMTVAVAAATPVLRRDDDYCDIVVLHRKPNLKQPTLGTDVRMWRIGLLFVLAAGDLPPRCAVTIFDTTMLEGNIDTNNTSLSTPAALALKEKMREKEDRQRGNESLCRELSWG